MSLIEENSAAESRTGFTGIISCVACGIVLKCRRVLRQMRLRAIFRKYKREKFTMLSERAGVANLLLCVERAPSGGCIVECGVWRGGMSAAMADALPGRAHFLFDSFEGLPAAKEIDGPAALNWQRDTASPGYFDNCRAERSFAEKAMRMSAAREFHLIQGWFDKTLPGLKLPEPIAVLRLDADWYESTMACLNALYPQVMPGGLVILDDYYTWDGCARAVHDYLSMRKTADRIHEFRGVPFLIKPISN
jgi:O-methyltransferase